MISVYVDERFVGGANDNIEKSVSSYAHIQLKHYKDINYLRTAVAGHLGGGNKISAIGSFRNKWSEIFDGQRIGLKVSKDIVESLMAYYEGCKEAQIDKREEADPDIRMLYQVLKDIALDVECLGDGINDVHREGGWLSPKQCVAQNIVSAQYILDKRYRLWRDDIS